MRETTIEFSQRKVLGSDWGQIKGKVFFFAVRYGMVTSPRLVVAVLAHRNEMD